MNVRISSVVTAIAYVFLGGVLAHAAPQFGVIYADLYAADATLPVLTRIVLAIAPVGWIALGVVAAAVLVAKDLCLPSRTIPNWPFVIALLVIGGAAVIALFRPLVITIQEMGAT